MVTDQPDDLSSPSCTCGEILCLWTQILPLQRYQICHEHYWAAKLHPEWYQNSLISNEIEYTQFHLVSKYCDEVPMYYPIIVSCDPINSNGRNRYGPSVILSFSGWDYDLLSVEIYRSFTWTNISHLGAFSMEFCLVLVIEWIESMFLNWWEGRCRWRVVAYLIASLIASKCW